VGELADRPPDFLAAAFSETAPLECVFLLEWLFPPWESLVDCGMCFLEFEAGPSGCNAIYAAGEQRLVGRWGGPA
jgi:hypothetical protein